MIYYVVPARRNSCGVPFKNRVLLPYTISTIINSEYKNTIVSTDDEYIMEKLKNTGIRILERSSFLSDNNTSIKRVMSDVIARCSLNPEDTIIMLYLVYPTRTRTDILNALSFYQQKSAKSLLCGYDVLSHPYLSVCMKNNCQGNLIVDHNLHRRQDYPYCVNLCHFVCIFNVGYLCNLSENLYNKDTYYYHINKPIDIDTQEDLKIFEELLHKKGKK